MEPLTATAQQAEFVAKRYFDDLVSRLDDTTDYDEALALFNANPAAADAYVRWGNTVFDPTEGPALIEFVATCRALCDVPVDAGRAQELLPVVRSLSAAGKADEAGEGLVRVFAGLDLAEQRGFIDGLAAIDGVASDSVDLANRSVRMIENAQKSPSHTKDLLGATTSDRRKLELHLDQIRRNGNDSADDVVTSARTGKALGNARVPSEVRDSANAAAEGGVAKFYVDRDEVVENLREQNSAIVRDRVFRDIHDRTPPLLGKQPDLLVAGEFRDVYRPNPLVSSNARAARNAADNKLLGQTQRMDIWLEGRSLLEMKSGWDEFVAELGGPEAFANLYTTNGRSPIEVVAIDSLTGDWQPLFPPDLGP